MDTALAPGYVRITYDGTLFPHHMVIPVNYDGTPTPGVEPDILLKDASSVGVETGIGDFVAEMLVFYPSSVHFGLAEAHTVDATTGEDQFIYAWNLNVTGSGVTAAVPTSQVIITFKLATGGLYKLYLLETANTPNQHLIAPFSDPAIDGISDFVVGDSSPVWGRTNAYPFAPISWIVKYNDKLRKQQGLA